MINVICYLRSGGDFTEEYVRNLFSGILRSTKEDFNFVCINNLKIPGQKDLENDFSGWWGKVELFQYVGKYLYFDLDTVIVGDITPMFNIVEELKENQFVGIRAFNPIRSANPKTEFNSGVMGWNGNFQYILENFDYKNREKYEEDPYATGDQDYISLQLRERNVEILFWQDLIAGVYSYKRHIKTRNNSLPKDSRVICFHGKPRPKDVEDIDWMKKNWRVGSD